MLCREYIKICDFIRFFVFHLNDTYYLNQGCILNLVMSSRWFHGKISRERAEQLLCPKMDGHFLVRESTNFPGDYTLCVCYQGKVEHYRVKYKDHKLTIDDEEFFETLAQLVEVHFSSFVSK